MLGLLSSVSFRPAPSFLVPAFPSTPILQTRQRSHQHRGEAARVEPSATVLNTPSSVLPTLATTLRCHLSVSSAQCLASWRDLERGAFPVGRRGVGDRTETDQTLLSSGNCRGREVVFWASRAGSLRELARRSFRVTKVHQGPIPPFQPDAASEHPVSQGHICKLRGEISRGRPFWKIDSQLYGTDISLAKSLPATLRVLHLKTVILEESE